MERSGIIILTVNSYVYLVTMPPRKTPAFTFYSTQSYPSDDEDDDPPIPHVGPATILGQRHVELNSNRAEGAPRRPRNVYLQSAASPAPPTLPRRSDHESSWNTEPPPPSDLFELYPFADPSYQHALDIMDPEVVPRRRTKSVSICCYLTVTMDSRLTLTGPPSS